MTNDDMKQKSKSTHTETREVQCGLENNSAKEIHHTFDGGDPRHFHKAQTKRDTEHTTKHIAVE